MKSDNDVQQLENEIKRLRQIYTEHVVLRDRAHDRKVRLEDLMKRKITKKWDQPKKAKMVRRLITVSNELKNAQDVIDQAEWKVNQLDSEKNSS